MDHVRTARVTAMDGRVLILLNSNTDVFVSEFVGG